MREAREIMAEIAATGLSPEQMALMMELSASLAVEARPSGEVERSPAAVRQAEYRERQKAQEDITRYVTGVTGDVKASRDITNGFPQKERSKTLSQSPPISPPFPVSEALAIWNEAAERLGLAKALGAKGKRLVSLKARLAEYGGDGFRAAVAAVERSAFCRGENNRGWRADIGFLLRPENFQKLIEGGFDTAHPPPVQSDSFLDSISQKYASAGNA